jgi:hypothetical protein
MMRAHGKIYFLGQALYQYEAVCLPAFFWLEEVNRSVGRKILVSTPPRKNMSLYLDRDVNVAAGSIIELKSKFRWWLPW